MGVMMPIHPNLTKRLDFIRHKYEFCTILKRAIIILFLLNLLSCFGQTTFKIIDGESKTPISGIYSTIYKNENSFVNCGCSNDDGYYTPNILKFDSTTQYQFSLDFMKYKPVWKEIDLAKSDTLVICVFKDEYYIENCDSLFSKRSSHYSWGKYTPRQVRSFNDIPKNIANKVKDYLKERVGNDLASDFELVAGQIIELDEFNKYFPGSTRKTAYYLGLSYRKFSFGISMYASNLELNENGDVVKDLQFPIVSNDTVPFMIYSFSKIKKKAQREEFYFPNKTKIDMEYDSEKNTLLWKFINEEFSNDNTFKRKQNYYNAQNGEYIGEKTDKGVWIE